MINIVCNCILSRVWYGFFFFFFFGKELNCGFNFLHFDLVYRNFTACMNSIVVSHWKYISKKDFDLNEEWRFILTLRMRDGIWLVSGWIDWLDWLIANKIWVNWFYFPPKGKGFFILQSCTLCHPQCSDDLHLD